MASVSVGWIDSGAVLDLNYEEDSTAQTDMNIVMDDQSRFIELQGTAEGAPFTDDHLQTMIEYARYGIKQLLQAQRDARIDHTA